MERLRERGIADVLREPGQYTYESGYAAAKRLLDRAECPDAIFCANDITALGALDAARALRVNVPDDLSVIGFDDIPAASWIAYNLTTVRQPINTMIDLSIKLLLEQIASPDTDPVITFVPGKWVQRGSARVAVEQDP